MDLSIVVPVYNEEKSITPLAETILDSVGKLDYLFEVLFIDDGSSDDTFEIATGVAKSDSRFRVIKLRRNSGQTAALYAGFEHAKGDIIVTMDGDLQNDPRDIGKMIAKMNEGYDVVTGWRENRQDRLVSRKIPSLIANWFIRKVTGSKIIDNGCALRAYKASVIKKFPLYSEMHRLLPTILTLAGTKIAQIKVRHHSRKYGSSKYGLSRTYKVLIDLISLKTIMTAVRLPFFGFGFFAILSIIIAVLAFFGGVFHLAAHPENTIVVPIGVSLLFSALGITLFVFGLLCNLIYTLGDLKATDLLKIESF